MFRGSTVYAGEKGSASRQLFERIAKTMRLGRGEYEYIDNASSLQDVAVVFGPISPERFLDLPDYVLSSLGAPQYIGSGGVIDAAVLLNPSFRSLIEQLQDEAFDLLVHEKLSADESFRIFVTLTNDVLGQLKTNRSKNLKI